MTEDGGFEELGEPHEVGMPRQPGWGRVLVTLLVAGFGLAALIVGGGYALTTVAQTEAGLCRVTPVPCTSLSLASVSSLAGVDLPPGSEVLEAYHHVPADAVVFDAMVRLPDGAVDPLTGTDYAPFESGGLFFDTWVGDLRDVRVFASTSSSDLDYRVAGTALDRDGRMIVMFTSREARDPTG